MKKPPPVNTLQRPSLKIYFNVGKSVEIFHHDREALRLLARSLSYDSRNIRDIKLLSPADVNDTTLTVS